MGGESKISTSRGETAERIGEGEGGEGRERTRWLRAEFDWGQVYRSNLIKYPSRIWINPILKEIDSFVHCDIPNETIKRSTRFESKRWGRRLHRRFEVKGEDSRWSYLSWSGRGAKESSSLAARRPPKAKPTSIPPAYGVWGWWWCRQRLVSITSRL